MNERDGIRERRGEKRLAMENVKKIPRKNSQNTWQPKITYHLGIFFVNCTLHNMIWFFYFYLSVVNKGLKKIQTPCKITES